jgi:hypothetical protein
MGNFHVPSWLLLFQTSCLRYNQQKGEKDKGTEKRTKDDAGSLLKAMPISGRKAEERNKY